jgi:hypothetical protein
MAEVIVVITVIVVLVIGDMQRSVHLVAMLVSIGRTRTGAFGHAFQAGYDDSGEYGDDDYSAHWTRSWVKNPAISST